MAGDDDALYDNGGGIDRDHPGDDGAHMVGNVNRATLAEAGAELTIGGIDLDQAAVERTPDDPRGAGIARLGRGHLVVSKASARGDVGDILLVDARIIGPFLLACGGVQRIGLVHPRAAVECVAHLERRRFGAVLVGLTLGEFPRVIGPDALQVCDVGEIDLVELRIALLGRTAAVDRPVGTGRGEAVEIDAGLWVRDRRKDG